VSGPRAAPVRIQLCGHLVVERDGHELADRALGSRKGRLLLQLLAAQRGRLVATERIADVLWAAEQPRDAAANVATLVSRLRSVLGDDVIAGSRAAYGLLPGGAWVTDVDAARQLVVEATDRHRAGEPGLACAAATRAHELLGDHDGLVELPGDDWLLPLREEIRGLRRNARHLAAVTATQTGDRQTARTLAEAAIAADALDEQACRDLMTALAADGESAAALSAYADLQRTLRRELGIDPHRDTREVHLTILRGGLPAAAAPVRDEGSRAEVGRLLGRADEVAAVREAWSAAVAGDPSLTLVLGEAGIGKSRLLAEVESLVRATGGVVLAARCHASERSLFLEPVVEALRPELTARSAAALMDLAGAHADALVGLLPQLAAALPGTRQQADRPQEPEAERRRAYEAVAHALARLSRDRPVLLALDDAQDAGLATVDLLDYLSRHLGAARVLLVASARSEESSALLERTGDRTRVVALGPLPVSAVTAMAAAAGHLDQAAALAARTKGHPFSVVEMLRALGAGESGIPSSLSAAVLRRVSRAGPDGEEAMQAAAVLGTQVDPAQLAGLLDVSELEAVRRCESLVTARLMTREGLGYEFANDLVQEVVYDAVPPPIRRAHHRRAADLLAEHPEALARHADAVSDWSRAARAWLLAGDEAMRRAAAHDAGALLERAAAAARTGGDDDLLARVLLSRARVWEALTDFEPSLADIDEALRLARAAGNKRMEMMALRARGGDALVGLHRPAAEPFQHLTDGLRLAGELADRVAEADFAGRLAVLETSRLRFEQALRHGQRSIAAARAAADDRALVIGLDGIKTAHAYLGDVGPLRSVIDELTPLLRRLRHTWLLQWCVFESSFVAMAAGDSRSTRSLIDESLQLNERTGYPAYAVFFLAHRGWFARLDGEIDAALDDGKRAVALAASVEHPWWLATAAGLYAATLLAAGQPDAAAEMADRGLVSVGDAAAEGYPLRCLAPLAAATGDAAALRRADDLLTGITAPPGQAWILGADAYLCIARAWLDAGDPVHAATALAPLRGATRPGHWAALHHAANGIAANGIAANGIAAQSIGAESTAAESLAAQHILR
jgi:DNA-binding SARP family transcriptional activator/tetratricopeptide (TPR) repeat protein